MSQQLRQRLFEELDALVLVDPHTHINPHAPAATTLADILGYHYYTELAHSAGMPKDRIEEPGLDPKEKVARLMPWLEHVDNTAQFSWLLEMARAFFGFEDEWLSSQNWEPLYDQAAAQMASADWAEQVLARSRIEAVFLTNDFDDPLTGFDTNVYIPCLRTDDLVFHLGKPEVQQRFERATGQTPGSVAELTAGIEHLFGHFVGNGARACAISLPPSFAPQRVAPARAETALQAVLAKGTAADESHLRSLSNFVFWTLAEHCDAYGLPFDLMIGVNRGVYEDGVYQGRDLFDSRVSLIQYKPLFNAFPRVKFPISVLASVTNQELTSYAWIFPNVVTNGHWWYSNTPTFIEHDLSARLEAVPQTKQIGYYSDMYKLEFALPKFAMYKRLLAKVLAERFVIERGWSEERALALGRRVLRGNVDELFPAVQPPAPAAAPDYGFAPPVAAGIAGLVAAGAAAAVAADPWGDTYERPPATPTPAPHSSDVLDFQLEPPAPAPIVAAAVASPVMPVAPAKPSSDVLDFDFAAPLPVALPTAAPLPVPEAPPSSDILDFTPMASAHAPTPVVEVELPAPRVAPAAVPSSDIFDFPPVAREPALQPVPQVAASSDILDLMPLEDATDVGIQLIPDEPPPVANEPAEVSTEADFADLLPIDFDDEAK